MVKGKLTLSYLFIDTDMQVNNLLQICSLGTVFS